METPNQTVAAKELGIPVASLTRWRDKIRNELFQQDHVSNLYADRKPAKKDKMFLEIDKDIYQWFEKNRANIQDINEEIL